MDRREHRVAAAPQRLAVLTGQPVQLGVADKLGREPIDREGGAVISRKRCSIATPPPSRRR
jgi:hypothetical protein